jgi:hypothetical protein
MHSLPENKLTYLGGCHKYGGIPDIVFKLIVNERKFLIGIRIEVVLVFVKWSSWQLSLL